MLNRVTIVGRITRSPELRSSVNGAPFTYFTVAVDNRYGANRTTAFIPCVAWNKVAETVCQYLKKGALVAVDGRLNTRPSTRDNQPSQIVEVVASSVSFLESKRQREATFNQEPAIKPGKPTKTPNNFSNFGDESTLNLDDLDFNEGQDNDDLEADQKGAESDQKNNETNQSIADNDAIDWE